MRKLFKKILVVDDDAEICKYLHEYFRELGYEVYTATSGEAALAIVVKNNPDVVLLDMILTGSLQNNDGIKVLQEIKRRNPAIHVIMVTAVTNEEVIEEAMTHGACDYISKPLSLEYLEKTVSDKIQAALEK